MKNKIGYKTLYGECICNDSLEELKLLEDKSIDLVLTSPPFALLRKKEYGNESQDTYVQWLSEFALLVFEKLKDEGSFVVDLGGAYEKGVPSYSLYQFKVLIAFCENIGFKLAQPFYWHNTSALPSPIEWVNKRKLRAKSSVNTVWWFCKDPLKCKANITNVLVPYSQRMLDLISNPDNFLKTEDTKRPSGHILKKSSWSKNNGGAIPGNLLQFSNSESNSKYLRYCKELGLKRHPARFPITLPEFFIKFLTEENDLVVDIFGGSNTTGRSAENLKRRWKSFEISNEYVATSVFRFLEDQNLSEIEEIYQSIINGNYIEIK